MLGVGCVRQCHFGIARHKSTGGRALACVVRGCEGTYVHKYIFSKRQPINRLGESPETRDNRWVENVERNDGEGGGLEVGKGGIGFGSGMTLPRQGRFVGSGSIPGLVGKMPVG